MWEYILGNRLERLYGNIIEGAGGRGIPSKI